MASRAAFWCGVVVAVRLYYEVRIADFRQSMTGFVTTPSLMVGTRSISAEQSCHTL